MHWIVTFDNKGMHFTSQHARGTFLEYRKQNERGKFKLSPHDKKSREQEGYYFGAIVPAYAEWSDNYDRSEPSHLVQIHELFKGAFNGEILTGLQGKHVRVGKSTTLLNKKEYGVFLERIERYFEQNQIPWPDPALYKKWRDQFAFDYPIYQDWLDHLGIKCNGDPIKL